MKKRIGTKFYDTNTAVLILPEIGLYRAKYQMTFFLYDGKIIQPISYSEAESLIKESCNQDALKMLNHKKNKKGNSMIAVSHLHADHLASYCRKNNISQKEVVESFIDSLPE